MLKKKFYYKKPTGAAKETAPGALLFDKKEKTISVGGDKMYPSFSLETDSTIDIESQSNFNAEPKTKFIDFINNQYDGVPLTDDDKIQVSYQTCSDPLVCTANVHKFITQNNSRYQALGNIANIVKSEYPDAYIIDYSPEKWCFVTLTMSLYDSESQSVGYPYPDGMIRVDTNTLKAKIASEFGETEYDPNISFIDFNIYSGGTVSDWDVTYGSYSAQSQSIEDWGITLLEDIDYTNSELYTSLDIRIDTVKETSQITVTDNEGNTLYDSEDTENPLELDQDDLDRFAELIGTAAPTGLLYADLENSSYHVEIGVIVDGATFDTLEHRGLENITIPDTSEEGTIMIGMTIGSEGRGGTVPAPEDDNQFLSSKGWKEIEDFVGVHEEGGVIITPTGDLADYITVTDASLFAQRFPSGMVLSNNTNGNQNSVFSLFSINDRNSDAISQFGWNTSHIYRDGYIHSYTVEANYISQNGNTSAYGTVLINKRTFIDWMNTLGLSSSQFVYPTYYNSSFYASYFIEFDGSNYALHASNHNILASNINLEDLGIMLNEEALIDSGFDVTSSFEINLYYEKGAYEGYVEVPTSDISIDEYTDWNTYSTNVTITPEQFATLDVDWENVYTCCFVYDNEQDKWLIYELQNDTVDYLCGNSSNPCSTSTQELILNNLFGGLSIDLNQYYTDNNITQLPDISYLPIPIINVTSEGSEPVIVPGTHGLVPAPTETDQILTEQGWKSSQTVVANAVVNFENNFTWIGTETDFENVNWDPDNPMRDASTGVVYHIIYIVED